MLEILNLENYEELIRNLNLNVQRNKVLKNSLLD